MQNTISRRLFLESSGAASLSLIAGLWSRAAAADVSGLRFGPKIEYSFEGLVRDAEARAGQPYDPPYRPAPEIVETIDYAAHGKIHFRRDYALDADGPGVYPATFFHLGNFFPKKVRMHRVEQGVAREILYEPGYFDMPERSVARQLPENAGFAGFRLHESRKRGDWRTQDWVAFLGASYFRAIGELNQYGISARGVAIDTAEPTPEEFPDFVAFYLHPALKENDPVIVDALLDGPRITGAYRFLLHRDEAVVMDIEARLFLRGSVARLGIAPLTSMFWFAEYGRERQRDWRPEVHDSDGLALWTGSGERLWRPLSNPLDTATSSFLDVNPRGFGLLQRDRAFDHYRDGVNYDRRPSLWVEPKDEWGAGAVQLVEIPTDDEIHDNIGAFWVPEAPAEAGNSYRFRYRLHWRADEPYPPAGIARTYATFLGRGGEPGTVRPEGLVRYVVEFAGGPLEEMDRGASLTAEVGASRGTLSNVRAEAVPRTRRWRAVFDLEAAGPEPVELRLYLRDRTRPMTETWLFRHRPGQPAG